MVTAVVVVTCGGQTFILSALKNSCFIANSFTFQMEADIETVLEATESLRSSSKGRHLDAVASFCSAKHGWDRTKTHAILDQAVCDGKLYTTMSHNKVSYRIQNQETIDTENEDLSRTSEMDFELPTSGEYVSVNDFKRLQVELEEFKRFSHGEILSLKAQIANRPSSPPQQTRVDPSEKDREALLGCLQDRIISLERQLCDKQKVIEFLLEGPRLQTKTVNGNKGCLDDETRFIPSGIQKLQETREPNVNSMKTKRLPKNEEAQGKQTEQIYVQVGKTSPKPKGKGQKSKVSNSPLSRDSTKSTNRNTSAWGNRFSILSSDDDESSNLETLENQAQSCSTKGSNVKTTKDGNTTKVNQRNRESKRNKKNILIIGDSMVKHLDGRKLKGSLGNGQNVYVKSFSGANTEDMADYSKPPMKRNPDVVILHVGTNSLGTNKPAEDIANEINDLAVDLRNGENEVVVSAIIPRGDDLALNEKGKVVNQELKALCETNDLDFIDHQNIDETKHLNGSALHLNRMGTVLLANNFTKYLKAH